MDKILGCASLRQSTGINIKPAGNLWHAPRIADTIGFPLNVYATINLQQLGCAPEGVSLGFRKHILEPFRKWVTRPRKGAAWIEAPATHAWVLENKGEGVHAHWAMHIPQGAQSEFENCLLSWIERCCGSRPQGSTLHLQEATQPKMLPYYFLKGAHPAVAAFYGTEYRPQGVIIGKRSGTSENVGAAAKVELRELGFYPRSQRRFFSDRPAQAMATAA